MEKEKKRENERMKERERERERERQGDRERKKEGDFMTICASEHQINLQQDMSLCRLLVTEIFQYQYMYVHREERGWC